MRRPAEPTPFDAVVELVLAFASIGFVVVAAIVVWLTLLTVKLVWACWGGGS